MPREVRNDVGIEVPNEARPHGIAHPKKAAMLAALARTGNVSAAARAAEVARRTHYDWLRADPDYATAVGDAMEEAVDILEAAARKRAILGSDVLLIFLLKAARPGKYQDRFQIQHAGSVELRAAVDGLREGLTRLVIEHPELARALEDEALGMSLSAPKEATR